MGHSLILFHRLNPSHTIAFVQHPRRTLLKCLPKFPGAARARWTPATAETPAPARGPAAAGPALLPPDARAPAVRWADAPAETAAAVVPTANATRAPLNAAASVHAGAARGALGPLTARATVPAAATSGQPDPTQIFT